MLSLKTENIKLQNIEKKILISSLSQKQMEIVAWLEFYSKYFFTIHDISPFFSNKKQRYNIIQRLLKKRRITRLNKTKYYLVPVKAKSGGWSEHPFTLADEIMNGSDYFIGGWAAANYWRLTDQIPFWIEVYTTKRQGKRKILNTGFIFRRTTHQKIKKANLRKINKHTFRIMSKEEMKKWMKLRESLI